MMLQRPEAKAEIETTQEAAGDKEAAVTEVAGAAGEAAEAECTRKPHRALRAALPA